MSKIAIIGATGNVGSRLVEEALRRKHTVTALARDTSAIEPRQGVSAFSVDALDAAALADAIAGHDAVFSATRFASVPEEAIVEPVKRAGVRRLLVVGGAGSLYAAPGQRVLDLPDFPSAYKPEATAGAAFLDALRRERDVDWTFVSPSAEFVPGARTQKFRVGCGRIARRQHGPQLDFVRRLRDRVPRRARKRRPYPAAHHRRILSGTTGAVRAPRRSLSRAGRLPFPRCFAASLPRGSSRQHSAAWDRAARADIPGLPDGSASRERADAFARRRGRAPALIAVVAGAGIGPVDERRRAARSFDHAHDGLRIRQAVIDMLRMRAIPVTRQAIEKRALDPRGFLGRGGASDVLGRRFEQVNRLRPRVRSFRKSCHGIVPGLDST